MGPLPILTLMLMICSAIAVQHQYKVSTENLTLDYVDTKYIDMKVGLLRRDNINEINVTVTMKCDLPESAKASTTAFKWFNGDYRIPIIQAERSVKYVLSMELFDLQSLWVDHARPPVVWPMEKGVTHRIEGWIPDSTKFPPNLPDGKWKFIVTLAFANKTKIVTVNWFLEFEYYKIIF